MPELNVKTESEKSTAGDNLKSVTVGHNLEFSAVAEYPGEQEFFDPSEPPAFAPAQEVAKPDFGIKVAPLSPAREWLYEHRRLDMKPYIDYRPEGPMYYERGALESLYPGIAPKIIKARRAGYTDGMIATNIVDMVDRAMKAGYTDGQIEMNLFKGYMDYGFFERPIGSFFYGRRENVLEKMWDYVGTTPDFETSPIKHELRAVVERGLSSFTAGLTDALQTEIAQPKTIPGAIGGSVSSLIGFILGPMKMAKGIIGGRLAPTSTGLRGIAQLMKQGGATLGLSGFLSSAIPAVTENDEATDAAVELLENTATMTLTGALYPVAGVIPTKPLRMAVGLAALDYIRGKGEFTIDDVVKGVVDGTIDREVLAERSFGYLLDLYFLNKVKPMREQLAGLEKNAMVRRMLELNAEETEQTIIYLRKANLIPSDPERFLNGLGKFDKIIAFGNEKNFNATYKMLINEQYKLAAKIQADILGKTTIRIPKELNALAQTARQFTKPVNFANAVKAKGKLTAIEKEALQKATKGDLKAFWKGVSDRDYLEKQSMIQHKSQSEKILDAMKTEIMFNKADTELQRLSDGKIRRAYQGAARALWDTSANIKKDLLKKGGALGKEAVIRHDLIRGASSKAALMIDQAAGKIYQGLNKSEEIILNRIIQSRRTIAIEKYRADIRHPAGLGLKEHQAYLDGIPKEQFMRLSERADLYFKEMDSQLSQLHKAGIISRESYKGLLEKGDYSPRRFIQHIDPERTYTFAGKKITIWDSGIKALDEGSYKTLSNNSRALLAQVVSRVQARIFRNQANRALYDLAKEMPDNGVVGLVEVKKVTKKGVTIYKKAPAGFEQIGVMIDGKSVPMNIPSAMAREWVNSDPAINSQVANMIGWLSGAKILRPMATGINPEFALTNLPRDIAHAWITTTEYSPHLPITVAQMVKDYAKVLPDTITRQGRWLDYLNQGGGMSFLTHQGHITRKGVGKLSAIQNVLGYLGETSEIWTRLALRERALRNGKPPHEATWIARNYLDFSQGGSFTKAADTAIPYLNAGVQGTRGLVRAAKEKPATFTYKLAEMGALATGLYLANRHTNRECWDSVSDHDKANYFIITTPLSYTDKEGNKRHLYFRIAKDQGQKLVCTVFENLMAKHLGEEISVDQVTEAARGLVTVMPTDLMPPTLDAALGYFSNKDFWRNEDIWKGPEVEPREEYRAYTHPALVEIGRVTGVSPERAGYALEQLLTYGNIYTSAVGGGLRLVMDKLPEDVKEQATQDMLRQAPFIRRVLKATDPYTKHEKAIDIAARQEETRRYVQTRTLDALSEQVYAGQIEKAKVIKFISAQPWQDRERLLERHMRYGKLRGIPDKRWWLNLIDLPPETAATVYWTRYQQADKAEQKRLDQYMRKVPGIITERFMLRLNQLKKKKE